MKMRKEVYLANGVKERFVKCGSGEDDLREASGARDEGGEAGARADIGDAVQGLGPPLVVGYPEAGNPLGSIHEPPDFLRQSEPAH